MKDELGDRMKDFYEDRTRYKLPRRTFTIIRIDGKAFHTYTRGLKRPFDQDLIDDMNETTQFLCENIQGCKVGYVQSDEITLVLTDFESNNTSAWFDGNVQKIVSIAASMATAKFNSLRGTRAAMEYAKEENPKTEPFWFKLAMFDARVYTIPHIEEVINNLIWRQQDATRNSIQAVAQSLFSHKELNGKTGDELQEMIFKAGQNWNDYPIGQKRGRVIKRAIQWVEIDEKAYNKALANPKTGGNVRLLEGKFYVLRNKWTVDERPPIFTQDKTYLKSLILGDEKKKEV